MKHLLTIALILHSTFYILHSHAAFTRLATETYPGGGGGGPTNGVTAAQATNIAAHVVSRDVAPWAMKGQPKPATDLSGITNLVASSATASTNYTDVATNALDMSHQSRLSQLSQSATNYTDSATLAATNFVKANYLPLDGRVGMTGSLMLNYTSGYPSIKFTRNDEQTPDYDFSIVDDTEVYYTTAFAFTDLMSGRPKTSYLVPDDSPVVTSNMLNGVLGPTTNALDTALRSAIADISAGSTNYTDVATNALDLSHQSRLSQLSQSATNYTDSATADVKRYSETNSYPFALGNMVSNTVSQWEGYWNGSNVYWSVTNYTERGNAKIMRLYEIQTNGVTREIWNDSDKYDIFFTNTLDVVSSTNAFTREWVGTFVTNSLDAKADRAWGKYTSAGNDVPDTNMVWHTAPTTVFAGGFEFQKVAVAGGEIGVLVSQGAVPYASGAEGKFIIGDGFGTNYFGYVKKDDYIIATHVDGITVDQATKMVTLKYDLVFSGEYPIVYYSPTVLHVTSQNWIQLNKSDGTLTPGAPWPVTFSTGAGYIKAHISFATATPSMPPQGFFTSSTAVIGGGTFKTNMKADFLDAGLMCTNTDTHVTGVIRPTFDGTTVHWNWSRQ